MTITEQFPLHRNAIRMVALLLLGGLYLLSRPPMVSGKQKTDLAARFRFTRLPLYEPPGYPRQSVRPVHPSLSRISAWVSGVGAAVALGDLDGDGLPNDVCHVDPWTDTVAVFPAPGTPARYRPLVLNPAPLPYDRSMAPMGCLPADLNEDGRMDLVVYYWGRTPVAFLRQGDGYVPQEIVPGGGRWYTNAATQADLDGDGHVDLVFGNYFPDGARILDERGEGGQTMQDSFSRAFNGGGKHFLLWAGAGSGTEPSVRFTEATGVLDEEAQHGWSLAVGAADLDGDLLPEIYFANDFGPDRLLHNRSTPGRLRFVRLEGRRGFTTPASAVLGRDSYKGMGVDFGDLNGDGLPDIYVSNLADEFAFMEGHFCFLSTGKTGLMQQGIAPYVNRSEQLGLARGGWAWEARLGDFDNDGVLEALQAAGFMKGTVNRWPELQELATGNDDLVHRPGCWPRFQRGDDVSGDDHNPFFVRGPDGRYVDIAPELGLGTPQTSRGIATADVDGDGDLDFAVANQWEASSLYRNECPNCGAFLGLHLLLPLGAGSSDTRVRPGHPGPDMPGRPAIGAAATIYRSDGRRLAAQVDGGSGHSGKRSPDLLFGLGHGQVGPVRVELRWRNPAGRVRQESLMLPPGWHTIQLGFSGRAGGQP